ncbi:hypothetical protein KKI24_14815 [bacterium]|nr:hypothetical protein [bacterium]
MKHRFNINMIFYYISFLLLLVAMVSIISLFQLGGAIDIILKENLPSAIAGEKMSESLTQIHLLILENQGHITKEFDSDINASVDDFTDSLIKAKHNITISGESDIIKEIETGFKRYRETIGMLKDQDFNSNTKYALSDLFRKNIDLIKQLISINNQAIITADETAKTLAKNRSIWMIFLALVGFVSVFYLIRTIQNKFSDPISEMLLNLRRANFGDHHVRLKKRDGELGELAEHINSLLDSKKTDQSSTLNYAFEQRDLLSALVEINPDPLFVFDVGYRMVLANEKARNILRHDHTQNLEERICTFIKQPAGPAIDLNGAQYAPKVSVLRDRGFTKIGYTIRLSESRA